MKNCYFKVDLNKLIEEINKIIMELYFTYDIKAKNGRISGDNLSLNDVIKLVNMYKGNFINKAK